ncbi:MAG TPA: NAD-dependent epimerase/dehydratase family protein [Desulfuromonadales bacterium]|nr:NAD-dependent epimerase/dehydratase family protein [Desulfuromonadales bacterium]
MHNVLIAGCGYIGELVARLCQEAGSRVTCLVRSPEHAGKLKEAGYSALVCGLDDAAAFPVVDLADSCIYYFVPPPGGGIVDSRARTFIASLLASQKPARIVYMSATSVYAEVNGSRVTEATPAEPMSAMGKRRRDAEQAFLHYGEANGVAVVILRVSGIYGPGRLPLMQISQGQPLLREEESGPSNRIHAVDLAHICLAAAEKGRGGEIFNVSDGHPSSMTTYFNACADALRMPRQPQVSLDEARQVMSPLMFSYVSESRIVENRAMLKRLQITLRYPTISEGLPASVPPSAGL